MARTTYEANHIAKIKLGSNTTAHIIDPDYLGGREAEAYALKSEVESLKSEVESQITAAQSKVFRYLGSIDNEEDFNTYIKECKKKTDSNSTTLISCDIGDVYIIGTAFSVTGTEINCEPGDLWIYNAENDEVEGEYQYWDVVQGNIDLDSLDSTYSKLGHTHSITTNVSVNTVDVNKSSIIDEGHDHEVNISTAYTPEGIVKIAEGDSTDTNGYKIQPTITDNGHTHTVTVDGTYVPGGNITISGAPTGSITYGSADANSDLSHTHTVSVDFGDYTPAGNIEDSETHIHTLTGGSVTLTADTTTTDGILVITATHTNPTVVAGGAHTHNFNGTKSTQFNTKSFTTGKFNAPTLGYSGGKGTLGATFAGTQATITSTGNAATNTTKLSTTNPVYIKATFIGTQGTVTQTSIKTSKVSTGISLEDHTHNITLSNPAVTTGGPSK